MSTLILLNEINTRLQQSMPELDVYKDNDRWVQPYVAIDKSTYDGATDGNNYIGTGDTEQEALDQLYDQLETSKLYPLDVLSKAFADYSYIIQNQHNVDDGIQDEQNRPN